MMNGGPTMPIPPLQQNPLVVMLEELVAQAKAGAINSFAYAAIGPQGQIAINAIGGRSGDLYTGLSMVRRRIISTIDPIEPVKRSPIVRAGIAG